MVIAIAASKLCRALTCRRQTYAFTAWRSLIRRRGNGRKGCKIAQRPSFHPPATDRRMISTLLQASLIYETRSQCAG